MNMKLFEQRAKQLCESMQELLLEWFKYVVSIRRVSTRHCELR